MSRWFALPAWLFAALGAFLFWWWQGRPVALPDAPSTMLPCLSYAPFRGNQSATDETLVVPVEQIEEDFRLLSRVTRCVRTYGVGQGLERIPEVARRFGMRVMLGAWIGADSTANARELNRAIEIANRYPETVSALIVGNEVLLRGELSERELGELLRTAGDAASVPVTHADVWEYWFRHRDVADAVDFVTIHILPYWDDNPLAASDADESVLAVWRRAKQVFPGKRVFVGETGWPSAGRMRGKALPSRVNQAHFVRELLDLAEHEQIEVNLIEAFDQPWKRAGEGTVGGYWGLYSEGRTAKFPLTGPVGEDPSWRIHFAWAAALAAVPVFFAAFLRAPVRPLGWLVLALASHAAASALVVAMANVIHTSLTAVDWAIGLGRWGLGAAAFAMVLRALLNNSGREGNPLGAASTRDVLAALRSRRFGLFRRFGYALGLIRALTLFGAAVVTLELAFDPRHRDFPIAVYAVPALAFLVLAWWRPGQRDADLREEMLLAGVLVVGGIGVGLLEGFANHQALAWAAVNFVLAGLVAREASCRNSTGNAVSQRL